MRSPTPIAEERSGHDLTRRMEPSLDVPRPGWQASRMRPSHVAGWPIRRHLGRGHCPGRVRFLGADAAGADSTRRCQPSPVPRSPEGTETAIDTHPSTFGKGVRPVRSRAEGAGVRGSVPYRAAVIGTARVPSLKPPGVRPQPLVRFTARAAWLVTGEERPVAGMAHRPSDCSQLAGMARDDERIRLDTNGGDERPYTPPHTATHPMGDRAYRYCATTGARRVPAAVPSPALDGCPEGRCVSCGAA